MNKYGKRFQGEEDIGFPIMEETPTIGTGPVSEADAYEMLMRMQEQKKREQNALGRSPSGMDEMRDMNTMMPKSTPSPTPSPSPSPSQDISGYDSAVISTATPYPVQSPETIELTRRIMEMLGEKNWKPDLKQGQYPKPIGPRPSPELEERLQKEKFDKQILEFKKMIEKDLNRPKHKFGEKKYEYIPQETYYMPAFYTSPTPSPTPSPSPSPSQDIFGTGLFESPEFQSVPESISEYDKTSPHYNPKKANRFKKTKTKIEPKTKKK